MVLVWLSVAKAGVEVPEVVSRCGVTKGACMRVQRLVESKLSVVVVAGMRSIGCEKSKGRGRGKSDPRKARSKRGKVRKGREERRKKNEAHTCVFVAIV